MKRVISLAMAVFMVMSIAPFALAAQMKDDVLNPIMNGPGTDINFENDAEHPWQVATVDGVQYARSAIEGLDRTTTKITATTTVEAGKVINFDYIVSSEDRYDKLIFGYTTSTSAIEVNLFDASGEKSGTASCPLTETAEYTFYWKYSKDISTSSNQDCAYVRNVVIGDMPSPTAINIVEGTAGLLAGETTSYSVTFEPSISFGDITWSSSNDEVAAINQEGIVTAVAPGHATITAACGDITDTVDVYVVEIGAAELYGIRIFSEQQNPVGRFQLIIESADSMTTEMLPFEPVFGSDSDPALTAGEYYNGVYYIIYGDVLYSVDFASGAHTPIGTCPEVRDMAYDYANSRMLGMKTEGSGVDTMQCIVEIDLETGETTTLSQYPGATFAALACGPDGTCYAVMAGTGVIYGINPDTGENEVVIETGYPARYLQSMTVDQETGLIYWAACSASDESLFMIDVEKGIMVEVYNMFGEVVGLHTIVGEVPEGTPVTGVLLDQTSLDLNLGETATLTATVTPADASNKRVTWSTSNAAVATVNTQGVVTAMGSGSAVITVTTADGGFTATCNVTVTGDYIFYEDFEDELEGWTILDVDGDGYSWTSMNAFTGGQIPAYEGSDMFTSQSYINGNQLTGEPGQALDPDNWLISPEFTLENGTSAILSWIAGSQDPSYLDHYSVYVGTGDATPETFTTELLTDHAPGLAGAFTADLSAYAGQTIRIAFRHHDSRDCYMLNIDLVRVAAAGDAPETVPVTGVTLNTTSADMQVGDTLTLTATVTPANATNKNVTWSSSNTAVATVANGVVTAVAPGSATITVTTVDGGFTYFCVVTVTDASIPVTGVILDTTSAEMTVGGELTLNATVLPENATNKNVIWSTSNETVATVIDGVVTAVAPGTAIITVATEDGGYTATCTITVTDSAVPVTGITLDVESAVMIIGGQLTINATVIPEDATNKNIVWTSSDESVATVENGVVTALAFGEVTITATTEDGAFTATCTINVYEMGDVTGDGMFNTGDAVAMLRKIAGLDNQNYIEELEDYNGDGQFNTGDAVAILRKIAGLE